MTIKDTLIKVYEYIKRNENLARILTKPQEYYKARIFPVIEPYINRFNTNINSHRSLFSFSDWADSITNPKPSSGTSPTINILLTIISFSLLFTSVLGFLGLVGEFLPFFTWTALSIFLIGAANYLFHGELMFNVLDAKIATKNSSNDDVDLLQLIRHLTTEVYVAKYGNNIAEIPMPLVYTFSIETPIIYTSIGRNRYEGTLFISQGMLKRAKQQMTLPQLAALIQKEIVKFDLYEEGYKRDLYGISLGIADTCASLLGGFYDNKFYKFLSSPLFLPFHMALLSDRAMRRRTDYWAGEFVCTKTYRGFALIRATEKKTYPFLKEEIPAILQAQREEHAKTIAPYQGHWFLKRIFDWSDTLEPIGRRPRNRWYSLARNVFREGFQFFRELYGPLRGNTERRLYRKLITEEKTGHDLLQATKETTKHIKLQQQQKNQSLQANIKEGQHANNLDPRLAAFAPKEFKPWKLSEDRTNRSVELLEKQNIASDRANEMLQLSLLQLQQRLAALENSLPPTSPVNVNYSHTSSSSSVSSSYSSYASSLEHVRGNHLLGSSIGNHSESGHDSNAHSVRIQRRDTDNSSGLPQTPTGPNHFNDTVPRQNRILLFNDTYTRPVDVSVLDPSAAPVASTSEKSGRKRSLSCGSVFSDDSK